MRTHGTGTPSGADDGDPVLSYALEQLRWYARTRDRSRRWHWCVELGSLAMGAATVVAAGLRAPSLFTAAVAGAMVFIGGFRQVFHHTERYVIAAEAWQRLHTAVRRYQLLGEAGRDEAARQRLLEQVEEVSDTETRHWAAFRRGAPPAPVPGPTGPPAA
ncbi:DUF4231 domain-containing protein [Streptomyces sp. NPDC054796]